MEFKWSIDKLIVVENNIVYKAHWRVTAIDGDLVAAASGVCTLNQSENPILYEQLTEQQVLNWCFEHEIVTVEDGTKIVKRLKKEGEDQVTGQIARQLAQKTSEPILPWVQNLA
jgi:hypothetical protein